MSDGHTYCEDCGALLSVGQWPFCHGDASAHQRYGGTAIDDQIPGGPRWFENLGDTPVYIETKTQLAQELKARNLVPFVRHTVSAAGSPHTSRWV